MGLKATVKGGVLSLSKPRPEPITMELGLSGTEWVMGLLAKVINDRNFSRIEGDHSTILGLPLLPLLAFLRSEGVIAS